MLMGSLVSPFLDFLGQDGRKPALVPHCVKAKLSLPASSSGEALQTQIALPSSRN